MRNLHPIMKLALAAVVCFLLLWFLHPFLNSLIDGPGEDAPELTVDEKIEIAREAGRQEGWEDGFDQGYAEGYDEGYEVGYLHGSESGYRDGYDDGYYDGSTS